MRSYMCVVALLAVMVVSEDLAVSEGTQVAWPAEATAAFTCPAGFDDVTQASDKQFTASIAGVSSVRLLVETRECKCRTAASSTCTLCENNGKKGLVFETLFRARTVDNSNRDKAVSNTEEKVKAVAAMKKQFDAYMTRRKTEQERVSRALTCSASQLNPNPKQEVWSTPDGHVGALDGTWGHSNGLQTSLKFSGKGSNARLRSLILLEMRKTPWATPGSLNPVFPFAPESKFVSGLKFKYHKNPIRGLRNSKCEPLGITNRNNNHKHNLYLEQIVVSLKQTQCMLYACLNMKVTKGKDPKGRVVRGWGTLGTVRPKYAQKAGSSCMVEQNKFSLAIDGAVRRAVAQFRFEVAECLLAGKWFASDGDAKDKDGKPLHYGFGCVTKSVTPSSSSSTPSTYSDQRRRYNDQRRRYNDQRRRYSDQRRRRRAPPQTRRRRHDRRRRRL